MYFRSCARKSLGPKYSGGFCCCCFFFYRLLLLSLIFTLRWVSQSVLSRRSTGSSVVKHPRTNLQHIYTHNYTHTLYFSHRHIHTHTQWLTHTHSHTYTDHTQRSHAHRDPYCMWWGAPLQCSTPWRNLSVNPGVQHILIERKKKNLQWMG